MVQLDYITDSGIPRRVQVLREDDNPDYGIPVDVFEKLEKLYEDKLDRKIFLNLWQGLWDRKLIEPNDYRRASAVNDIRSALSSVYAIEINEIKLAIAER